MIYFLLTKKKIRKKFIECEENINKCISHLNNNNNLKDTRNDFLEKEKLVIQDAEDIYSSNNSKINYIIKDIIDNANNQILNILKHTEKENEEGNAITNKEKNNKININAFAEANFVTKAINGSNLYAALHFIPGVSIIPLVVDVVGGLIDHFRNHSEEYLKEIQRIKKEFKSTIDNDLHRIENDLENYLDSYIYQINNIFNANGKDLEKIWKNNDILISIIKDFEDFMKKLLNKN